MFLIQKQHRYFFTVIAALTLMGLFAVPIGDPVWLVSFSVIALLTFGFFIRINKRHA